MLSSADLISYRANLSLIFVIRSILLIKKESQVLHLLPQGVSGDHVLIVSVVVIVILHELFILEMSVLLLNGVQLVTQGEVVLVPLLDLEDLRLQLRDQEILLVAGEVHRIVVLSKIRKIERVKSQERW